MTWTTTPRTTVWVLVRVGVTVVELGSLKAPACVCVLSLQSCPTLCDPMDCSPPGSSVHGDSPGKDTRVSCHVLFQGIFPIQGSNPYLLCLLHGRVDSLPLAPPGKPLKAPGPSECLCSSYEMSWMGEWGNRSRTIWRAESWRSPRLVNLQP